MKDLIYISKVNNTQNIYRIHTFSKAIKIGEDVIVKVKDEFIQITRPNLDYRGKTNKVSLSKFQDGKNITFECLKELPTKILLPFDKEESNEDKIIIYFNQN